MQLERIGKYKILEEVGRGTMGTVYKAHDPVLNRYVAIKTLSSALAQTEEVRTRFHREAQAAALLAHPNIITVHDFGEEQGLIYMAMELLEGVDLREAIGSGMLATLDDKLSIMDQICTGLAFAHSKSVVHRDLKPANVHIQAGGQVKIMDFGLARLGTQELTQAGIVLGTPNYMSPEQALGDKVDARTDVFSAGVIFYEVLTNHKPFDADSTPGVLYQVVHKKPAPVRQWAPDVPTILVDVVEKAMDKDKKQRFQNASQMRHALFIAHRALEAGRGPDATLAGESQRAARSAKDSPPRPAPTPRAPTPPSWVEGTVALDMSPAPAAREGSRPPDTARPAQTDRQRVSVVAPSRRPLYLAAGGLGILAVLAAAIFWLRRPSAPTSPAPEVGALTQALVETQIQLGVRDLEDKNYRAAMAQAERVLKLAPRNAEARRILETARARRDELELAARQAKEAFEDGRTEEASQALSRVLELDPKHPVAGELTARLNSVFSSRAEEASRSMARSRAEAEKTKAGSREAFGQAVALASEAEVLFKRGEFAAATRGYLESRDAFDRARRSVQAPAAAPSGPAVAAPAPAPAPAVAAAPSPETLASAPAPEQRHFVTGKTLIASAKAGGDLQGFDTSDVRKQRIPDLVGRIEFEPTPTPVKAGEHFTVRIYLVNDGKKPVKIKAISLVTTVNGKRAAAAATPLTREVGSQQRALVAELRGVWSEGVTSWSLEAIVTSDRDDTGTGRLNWM